MKLSVPPRPPENCDLVYPKVGWLVGKLGLDETGWEWLWPAGVVGLLPKCMAKVHQKCAAIFQNTRTKPNASQKYCESISHVYQKYCKNTPNIYQLYRKSIPKVYKTHQRMAQIARPVNQPARQACQNYVRIPEVHQQYAKHMPMQYHQKYAKRMPKVTHIFEK